MRNMPESTLIDLEKLFLALSDKTRLRLLALMAGGEVSVGYLADKLGESQPKISRHLAYLRSAGLVWTRRDGKWVYYGIALHDDALVANVLVATLNAVSGNDRGPIHSPANIASGPETDIYAEAYVDNWTPNEMPVYLL
jgi:DNA-binding transcriptional ArsR family regulator